MEENDFQPRDHCSKLGIGKRSKHGDKPTGNPDYQRHCHGASPETSDQCRFSQKRYFKVVKCTRYLSKRPVGDTKIPLPIIVPTINEMPLKRPTVRFNSNGASVSLGRECLVFGFVVNLWQTLWSHLQNPCCHFFSACYHLTPVFGNSLDQNPWHLWCQWEMCNCAWGDSDNLIFTHLPKAKSLSESNFKLFQ